MQNLEQDVKRLPKNLSIDVFVVFDMDVIHRNKLLRQYNDLKEKLCGIFANIYFIEVNAVHRVLVPLAFCLHR